MQVDFITQINASVFLHAKKTQIDFHWLKKRKLVFTNKKTQVDFQEQKTQVDFH